MSERHRAKTKFDPNKGSEVASQSSHVGRSKVTNSRVRREGGGRWLLPTYAASGSVKYCVETPRRPLSSNLEIDRLIVN